MDQNLSTNITTLEKFFSSLADPKERYHKIISLGETLPLMPVAEKREENRVYGCQSTLYLSTYLNKEKTLCFYADADALISKGLAAVLILAYTGAAPLSLIQESPTFLEKWQIPATLSLNRAHGLAHIYLKMKQQAVKLLQEPALS